MKPYIPAFMEPMCGLVVSPAEKEPLLGSRFDSSRVVSSSTHLCQVSISLGAILWPSGLLFFASAS